MSCRLSEVGSVGEAAEFFLHSLGENWRAQYQRLSNETGSGKLTGLYRRQNRSNAGELLVEVAGISGATDGRQERRRDPLVVDIIPVDIPEEGMGHDFLSIRGTRAESELRFASEQLLENGNRVAWHVDRIKWLVRKNSVVDLVFILTAEWGLLKEHLVNEYTECPPVNCASIFLIQENL